MDEDVYDGRVKEFTATIYYNIKIMCVLKAKDETKNGPVVFC